MADENALASPSDGGGEATAGSGDERGKVEGGPAPWPRLTGSHFNKTLQKVSTEVRQRYKNVNQKCDAL